MKRRGPKNKPDADQQMSPDRYKTDKQRRVNDRAALRKEWR
jgi:hypothetical protein